MSPPLAAADLDAPRPPSVLVDASLFFDLDGTLIELAATPDAVVVDPALVRLLERLAARMPGRVAIVSGRSLAQVDALLGPIARVIAVGGSHGAELRVPGRDADAPTRSPALDAACAALERFAQPRSLLTERKTLGTALHYRLHPELEGETVAAGEAIAAEFGVKVQRGKMMIELRSDGDKGKALTAMLRLPAMTNTHPLFFGDDVTDEDGFIAAAVAGGAGVLIGDVRPSAATYRLRNVAALHAWMAQALENEQ
jgi:trehalose 6-phosphate phosphatase